MEPTINNLKLFPIEIQRISDEDGGGYSACIPLLGRLAFEASGQTIDAALQKLEEVAKILIEEYKLHGIQFPEAPRADADYSGRLVLRLPKHLHKRLSDEAEFDGISLNTYLISILSDSYRSPRSIAALKEIRDNLATTSRAVSMHIAAEPHQMSDPKWDVIYGSKSYGKAI
jgi:antitoxin HicB